MTEGQETGGQGTDILETDQDTEIHGIEHHETDVLIPVIVNPETGVQETGVEGFEGVGLGQGHIQGHVKDIHHQDQDLGHFLLNPPQGHQVQAQGHLGLAPGQGQDQG